MIVWKEVYSTNVDQVGYDDKTDEMLVRWRNGKISAYAEVPQALIERATKAWSVGSFIATEIKGKYSHRYVT